MKQSRRKELKTNELSLYLQQLYESAQRNSTYILGGLVAIVLILVIGLYIQHSRHQARADASRRFGELSSADPTTQPALIDEALALADEREGDPIGGLARALAADMAYRRAMALNTNQRDERAKLLDRAAENYQLLVQAGPKQQNLFVRAHLGLAAVEETRIVEGNGKIETAAEHYREVLNVGPTAFTELAREKLETLPQRTKKIHLVASRPAESAPATSTAPAATRPATTAPAAGQPTATAPAATATAG